MQTLVDIAAITNFEFSHSLKNKVSEDSTSLSVKNFDWSFPLYKHFNKNKDIYLLSIFSIIN